MTHGAEKMHLISTWFILLEHVVTQLNDLGHRTFVQVTILFIYGINVTPLPRPRRKSCSFSFKFNNHTGFMTGSGFRLLRRDLFSPNT